MTWLLGVRHDDNHLDAVLRRLAKEELAGKKVMVEMYSYPMEEEMTKKPWKLSKHFVNQWNSIAGYVVAHGGQLVFGEDRELFYGAQEEMHRINQQIEDAGRPAAKIWRLMEELDKDYYHNGMMCGVYHSKKNELLEQKAVEQKKEEEIEKELRKQHDEAPAKYRQPHFAKVVIQERPDIIILATAHMPYIAKNCFSGEDYRLTCIPSEGLGYFYEGLRKICNIEEFSMDLRISPKNLR